MVCLLMEWPLFYWRIIQYVDYDIGREKSNEGRRREAILVMTNMADSDSIYIWNAVEEEPIQKAYADSKWL